MDAPFLAKIAAIGEHFHEPDPGFSAVLLIGVTQNDPLTILDGNHRLVAAMLASPASSRRSASFAVFLRA